MLLSNPDRQHRISWLQMLVVRVYAHTEMNFQGETTPCCSVHVLLHADSLGFRGPFTQLNVKLSGFSGKVDVAKVDVTLASALMSFIFLVTAVLTIIQITIGAFLKWQQVDHDVGTCDLTGQTRTESAAHKGMIGGCHVLITADLVGRHVFDGGWRGGESRCGNSPCDWFPAQPGSRAPSAYAIPSVRIYITICHIVIYLELLVLSLSVLHHVFMLLWPQKQCG